VTTPCEHPDFVARVECNRVARSDDDPTIIGYAADLHIECASCGEPFIFFGAPVGLMPDRPTISADGLELRTPIRPQSADPNFGLGLTGFIARVLEGNPGRNN
jgi:hypothetical protein